MPGVQAELSRHCRIRCLRNSYVPGPFQTGRLSPQARRFLVTPTVLGARKGVQHCQIRCSTAAAGQQTSNPAPPISRAWRLPKLAWIALLAACAFLTNASKALQLIGLQANMHQMACLWASAIIFRLPNKHLRLHSASGSYSLGDQDMLPGHDEDTEEIGQGDQSMDQISVETAEEAEEAVASAASAVGDNQIGNVLSPASVWLPYRDSNTERNRVTATVGPAKVTIGGRLGRGLLQVLRFPVHALNLLSFKAQQVMLASTGTKLVAVFAAGIPLCVLGGVVYAWTSGKTLMDGFISAYGALYKVPGVTVIGEINATTAHVMNILWLVGTFTFAIVLGVVTEDIVNHVINIKRGNYDVVAANHTLILNWNSQTISLLRQIAINKEERPNGSFDGPVVILSDRDKEELDDELRQALRGFKLEWHTRQGAPHSINDLQRVAAGQAKTVILLNPDTESEEVLQDIGKMQVATILGVQSSRAKTKPRPFLRLQPQQIAVQVPENAIDKDLISKARAIMHASTQKFDLTYLSCKRDISTLLALSAIQPGVASVYCTIVQQTHNGVEFYLKEFEELQGKSFAEARRLFDDAVLCGYMRHDEEGTPEMFVNPKDNDILQAKDRVIALSQTGHFTPVANRKKEHVEKRLIGREMVQRDENNPDNIKVQSPTKPKHIVVVWHEDRIHDLLAGLAHLSPEKSTVSVISREKPKDFPENTQMGNITIKFTEGEAANADLIKEAGVAFADSIVIGGVMDDADAKHADALSVSLIMLIQECLAEAGRDTKKPAHIVGIVRKIDSVEVANYLMDRMGKDCATAELIHPDELVAGIISQVAAEPDMGALLAALVYSSEGSEIFLRRPKKYSLPEDQEISFAQVQELCRLRQEIAIGYISDNGEMMLAPRSYSSRKYTSSDRILTIAEG